MDRRAFLQRLLGGAAGVAVGHVLDLERLLWVPGAKTIVLPPAAGWGHTLVSTDWIVTEALDFLEHNLMFARQINRHYDERFITTDPLFTVSRRTR